MFRCCHVTGERQGRPDNIQHIRKMLCFVLLFLPLASWWLTAGRSNTREVAIVATAERRALSTYYKFRMHTTAIIVHCAITLCKSRLSLFGGEMCEDATWNRIKVVWVENTCRHFWANVPVRPLLTSPWWMCFSYTLQENIPPPIIFIDKHVGTILQPINMPCWPWGEFDSLNLCFLVKPFDAGVIVPSLTRKSAPSCGEYGKYWSCHAPF